MLVLLLFMNAVYAQAIQTITCPKGSPYKCVASNETCGWRNERPTAAELESAKHGGLELAFSCPTLPNGIEMELCWIDRKNYCKAPSPADVARAEKVKREREEKARQEQLAAERKKAEVAREIAILGPHREAEARRLVEMREQAERARGMKCTGTKSVKVNGDSDPEIEFTATAIFPGWSTRAKALASARHNLGPSCRNLTGESGIGGINESCSQDGFKKWTCTVEATCTKQVPRCPTGAQ